MLGWIIGAVVYAALLIPVMACMVMSGRCSREEEAAEAAKSPVSVGAEDEGKQK